MVTTYAGWVADGRPFLRAQPIADMKVMFAGLGHTVYDYPDDRHLKADPPEDHTPYSHTPWPGAQPYPYGMALDVMPKDGQDARWMAPLARAIIADKDAGRAPWVKYLNWTDEKGNVWHTKWQPSKVTTTSSDSGHLHISIRTDYVHSDAARDWNPIMTVDPNADFTSWCTGPSTRKNTRDNIIGDQGSLRDWWYGIRTAGQNGTNPPPAGSRLTEVMGMVDTVAAWKASGVPVAVTLTDAQLASLADMIASRIQFPTYAPQPPAAP